VIEQPNPLSLIRPCELLGLSRVALYYRPAEVSAEELELMALIDRRAFSIRNANHDYPVSPNPISNLR
jgi:hypothetical protein